MKKLGILLVMMFLLIVPSVALAAPDYISGNFTGNSSDLVVVTNPPPVSSTTQKSLVVSGYGKQGTKVTLYTYSGGRYVKMWAGGNPISMSINSSGLFWRKVELPKGKKSLLVYAENDGKVQAVRLEVNVLNPNIVEIIKDFSDWR